MAALLTAVSQRRRKRNLYSALAPNPQIVSGYLRMEHLRATSGGDFQVSVLGTRALHGRRAGPFKSRPVHHGCLILVSSRVGVPIFHSFRVSRISKTPHRTCAPHLSRASPPGALSAHGAGSRRPLPHLRRGLSRAEEGTEFTFEPIRA